MAVLRRDDVELYYERDGDGPPLLLIAGLFEEISTWSFVREGLSRDFDVIAFDNRCTGQSHTEPCISGRKLLVDDCLALIDHLGLSQPHVVGHAVGATIGLHLAAHAPVRVASLVMAAGGPAVSRRHIALFEDMAALYCSDSMPRHQWYELFYQWLYAPTFLGRPARMEAAVAAAEAHPHRQSRVALQAQVDALEDFRSSPELETIGTPILALTGADDLLFPPEDVMAALKPLPNLREVMLSDTAHVLHREDPDGFVEAIKAFHAELQPHFADQVGSTSPEAGVAL